MAGDHVGRGGGNGCGSNAGEHDREHEDAESKFHFGNLSGMDSMGNHSPYN
jgi:hypothetical protein